MSSPCCNSSTTLPTILHLTDVNRSITLTYATCGYNTTSLFGWAGGYTLSGKTVNTNITPNCSPITTGAGTLVIRYTLVCSTFTGGFVLSRQWQEIFLSGSSYYWTSSFDGSGGVHGDCFVIASGACATPGPTSVNGVVGFVNCSTLSWSGTLPSGGGTDTDPVGGTVTLSR